MTTPESPMPPEPPDPERPTPAPQMRPDEEKNWAIAAHLGPLVLGLFAPLIVWLLFKDRSAFLDRHGKEALNFQISLAVYLLASSALMLVLIGFILFPVIAIAGVVFMVSATIKAANYEDYRYPFTFRLVQ